MSQKKTVAVIGGGSSGIVTVKECLVHGLLPTCFEQKQDIGGIWLVEEPSLAGEGGKLYKGLIQNGCKDYFCYSDFPHPPETPCLMPATAVKPYLHAYCHKFGLSPYIHCNRTVVHIKKSGDYDKTGNWMVTHHMTNTKEDVKTETFNAIIVCSGFFSKPVIPIFGNESKFKGQLLHSSQVWEPKDFAGKTVITIGSGISGVDMAAVLAPHAKQITMVTRNGCWVLPTFFPNGKCWEDFLFNRKFMSKTNLSEIRQLLMKEIATRWNLGDLGFSPRNPILGGGVSIAVSDHIAQWIGCDKAKVVHGEVDHFVEDGILLKSGDTLKADTVILCTGYDLHAPFIQDKNIFPDDPSERDWWNYFYPINQSHPSLFLHTCFYHVGAAPSISEIQARASCGILSGQLQLPPIQVMKDRIKLEKEAQIGLVGKFPGVVNGWMLSMEVSQFVGCYPDLWKIGRKNAKLAWEMLNGPVFPAHYRLIGRHSNWEAACTAMEQRKAGRFKSSRNEWKLAE